MKKEKKEVVVKKKFKLTKFLIVLLLLYLFGFFIYEFINSPITNIFISNNNYLTDQEIIDISGLKNYPSFFLTTKSSIKKKLIKNELISTAKINKKLFGQVYIEVTENEPLFYFEDKKATILTSKEEIKDNNYLLPILRGKIDDETLSKFINKYKDINSDVKLLISEIEYVPNDIDSERFVFTMNDGNYVYITLYKISAINDYVKILSTLENKKGILYLDSGNYFEILK